MRSVFGRRLRCASLVLFLCAFAAAAPAAQAQRIPVYATDLVNSLNQPLTGQICWQPVGNPDPVTHRAGAPISFANGGTGGYTTSAKVCYPVSGGAFGPISLPDTALTSTINACFHVTTQDPGTSQLIIDDACVQPSSLSFAKFWCSASTTGCDFDKFRPLNPGIQAMTAGPPGQPGPPGQGIPGNAGTLATPQSAGVLYLPPGGTATTLAAEALTGASTDLAGALAPSGPHRGTQAMTGFSEQFTPDGHCYPGSTNVIGFDYSTANTCANPGFLRPANPGTTFELVRNLTLGTTNAIPPAPTHWAATMTDVFDGSSNGGYVGFSNCAISTYDCGTSNEVVAFVRSGGFGVQVGTAATTLWATGGNNGGTPGTTDSGPISGTTNPQGWAAPATGNEYDVAVWNPGDGTAMLSVMPQGGRVCCGAAFRIPVTYPSGNTHQFLVRGFQANDYLWNVGEGDGYTLQPGLPVYDMPSSPNVQAGRMMRWALHADGTEWNYQGSCSDCSNVWAWVPPSYNPAIGNPCVVHFHGNENGIVSMYSSFDGGGANVADTLFQAGYVLISIDFHQQFNYGNPQSVLDVGTAVAKVRSALSLAGSCDAMADSAGGLMVLNAISHGTFLPKAVLCYSCNTNLLADSVGNDIKEEASGSNQMGLIESVYGFTAPAQYPQYTAGYDPNLVAANPGVAQGPTTGTNALLVNAAQVLASIPMLFIADPSDQTVNTSINSIQMVNQLNALRAGSAAAPVCPAGATQCGPAAAYFSSTGGHVGPQEMNGAQALAFFNQY